MNKIELLMKVVDTSSLHEASKEVNEELKLNRLLNKTDDEEDGESLFFKKIKFEYKPYTVDLRDVLSYGEDDDEHTKLIFNYGIMYTKVPYNEFSQIYSAITGLTVRSTNDFQFQ